MKNKINTALLLLIAITPSQLAQACQTIDFKTYINRTAIDMKNKAAPTAPHSTSEDPMIKNCILNEGDTELKINYGKTYLLTKMNEKGLKIYKTTLQTNLSCEFADGMREKNYVRLPFSGEVIYSTGVINDMPETSCDGMEYSEVMGLTIDHYPVGMMRLEDIWEELDY